MEKQHKNFVINGAAPSLDELWGWLDSAGKVVIASEVKKKMDASRKVVDSHLNDGKAHYGINTGFGNLANTRVSDGDLETLQYNFVKSHAAGVGEPFPDDIVRLIMLLRANVLAMGYSGVRYELLEYLIKFINKGKIPHVPSQGSVGASGDLAPLAHIALALVEDGLKLAPKEGLSLVNGTQASLAVAVAALRSADKLIKHANAAAALSLEGERASLKPFDNKIALVRPHAGHADIAKFIRGMLKGSKIIKDHKHCSRVQDPYSFRCIPQVHGAVLDAYRYARRLIEFELASSTDNPLVLGDEIVSGGNFHGVSVAFACDHLSHVMATFGGMSERRTEQMTNPKQGELIVKGLVKNSGLNSGLLLAHTVAASIVSENKTLAHPASVDSLTTFGGQEDFVSMSMWAARKLVQIITNCEKIIAIELLSAAQAVDMHERHLDLGSGTKVIYDAIRKQVPTLETDRVIYKDIEKVLSLMKNGELLNFINLSL